MTEGQLASSLWALGMFAFGKGVHSRAPNSSNGTGTDRSADVSSSGGAAIAAAAALLGLKDLPLLLNALVIKSQGRLTTMPPHELAMAAWAFAKFEHKVGRIIAEHPPNVRLYMCNEKEILRDARTAACGGLLLLFSPDR